MNCETFALKYLPTIRKHLVNELSKEYGLSQVKISAILNITQPAVSQYISGLRGNEENLSENTVKKTKEVAEQIYRLYQKNELSEEKLDELMCRICENIQR